MPELPEVEALTRFLDERTRAKKVVRVDVAAFSALKSFDPPLDALKGRAFDGWERHGKYLAGRLDDLWLAMHLARGGWVQWREQLAPGRPKLGRGPLALRVGLDSGAGFDVTEQGTEKRLAIWLVPSLEQIEGIARLGPDPLAPGFDGPALARALSGQSANLKTALTDQSVLAGVGNAYSDEALHLARMSPFKPAGRAATPRRSSGSTMRWLPCSATPRSVPPGSPPRG